ncbi:hypothetical protein V2J09_003327 [Rumex salicifolius]
MEFIFKPTPQPSSPPSSYGIKAKQLSMPLLQCLALSTTSAFSSIRLTQHHLKSHLKMVMNTETDSKKVAQLLSPDRAKELFSSVDAFVFDCDGVIWKGSKLIDGVAETLEMLRSKEKQFVFVSNNSTKSRRQFIQKFQSFGIPADEEELLCSSFAAPMYLNSIQFPKDKKVYVVGDQGLVDELQLAGYTCLGGPEDGKKTVELKANAFFEHDRSVGAVVVGMDQYINYYKIMYATLCLRENPGCLFIATELDPLVHMTDSQEWPVTGSMVAAIRASTQKEPIVVGKPSAFLMEFLLNKFRCDPLRMCVIGDNLYTDILFGKDAGCKTLLVLTGVTNESRLGDPSNEIQPDYYTSKVSDVLELFSPSFSPSIITT